MNGLSSLIEKQQRGPDGETTRSYHAYTSIITHAITKSILREVPIGNEIPYQRIAVTIGAVIKAYKNDRLSLRPEIVLLCKVMMMDRAEVGRKGVNAVRCLLFCGARGSFSGEGFSEDGPVDMGLMDVMAHLTVHGIDLIESDTRKDKLALANNIIDNCYDLFEERRMEKYMKRSSFDKSFSYIQKVQQLIYSSQKDFFSKQESEPIQNDQLFKYMTSFIEATSTVLNIDLATSRYENMVLAIGNIISSEDDHTPITSFLSHLKPIIDSNLHLIFTSCFYEIPRRYIFNKLMTCLSILLDVQTRNKNFNCEESTLKIIETIIETCVLSMNLYEIEIIINLLSKHPDTRIPVSSVVLVVYMCENKVLKEHDGGFLKENWGEEFYENAVSVILKAKERAGLHEDEGLGFGGHDLGSMVGQMRIKNESILQAVRSYDPHTWDREGQVEGFGLMRKVILNGGSFLVMLMCLDRAEKDVESWEVDSGTIFMVQHYVYLMTLSRHYQYHQTTVERIEKRIYGKLARRLVLGREGNGESREKENIVGMPFLEKQVIQEIEKNHHDDLIEEISNYIKSNLLQFELRCNQFDKVCEYIKKNGNLIYPSAEDLSELPDIHGLKDFFSIVSEKLTSTFIRFKLGKSTKIKLNSSWYDVSINTLILLVSLDRVAIIRFSMPLFFISFISDIESIPISNLSSIQSGNLSMQRLAESSFSMKVHFFKAYFPSMIKEHSKDPDHVFIQTVAQLCIRSLLCLYKNDSPYGNSKGERDFIFKAEDIVNILTSSRFEEEILGLEVLYLMDLKTPARDCCVMYCLLQKKLHKNWIANLQYSREDEDLMENLESNYLNIGTTFKKLFKKSTGDLKEASPFVKRLPDGFLEDKKPEENFCGFRQLAPPTRYSQRLKIVDYRKRFGDYPTIVLLDILASHEHFCIERSMKALSNLIADEFLDPERLSSYISNKEMHLYLQASYSLEDAWFKVSSQSQRVDNAAKKYQIQVDHSCPPINWLEVYPQLENKQKEKEGSTLMKDIEKNIKEACRMVRYAGNEGRFPREDIAYIMANVIWKISEVFSIFYIYLIDITVTIAEWMKERGDNEKALELLESVERDIKLSLESDFSQDDKPVNFRLSYEISKVLLEMKRPDALNRVSLSLEMLAKKEVQNGDRLLSNSSILQTKKKIYTTHTDKEREKGISLDRLGNMIKFEEESKRNQNLELRESKQIGMLSDLIQLYLAKVGAAMSREHVLSSFYILISGALYSFKTPITYESGYQIASMISDHMKRNNRRIRWEMRVVFAQFVCSLLSHGYTHAHDLMYILFFSIIDISIYNSESSALAQSYLSKIFPSDPIIYMYNMEIYVYYVLYVFQPNNKDTMMIHYMNIINAYKKYSSIMIWYLFYISSTNNTLFKEILSKMDHPSVQRISTCIAYLESVVHVVNSVHTKQGTSTRSSIDNLVFNSAMFKSPPPPKSIAYPDNTNMNVFDRYGRAKDSSEVITISYPEPKFYHVFSSKDAPIWVKFVCSDNETRSLIFKRCVNTANESILSQVLRAAVTSRVGGTGDVSEAEEVCAGQIIYRITSINKIIVCLEFVPLSKSITSLKEANRVYAGESASMMVETKQSVVMREFYRFFFENLSSTGYFQVHLNVHSSLGFWSGVGYFLGLGDRNLNNIMVKNDGSFFYIDFEAFLGLGKDLPVPEIIEIRFGPSFQNLVFINNLYAMFNFIMSDTLAHLQKRVQYIVRVLLQLTFHAGEKFFFDKKELAHEDFIVDFFDQKVNSIRSMNPFHFVKMIINNSMNKSSGKLMFDGWEANI